MTDFGRVGKIKVERRGYGGDTDCVFMVVADGNNPAIRRPGKTMLRKVIVLDGHGYDTDLRLPGELGLVTLDDEAIEWLDDA
jgi:hypothetical protein